VINRQYFLVHFIREQRLEVPIQYVGERYTGTVALTGSVAVQPFKLKQGYEVRGHFHVVKSNLMVFGFPDRYIKLPAHDTFRGFCKIMGQTRRLPGRPSGVPQSTSPYRLPLQSKPDQPLVDPHPYLPVDFCMNKRHGILLLFRMIDPQRIISV